jgi:hypothetical protein
MPSQKSTELARQILDDLRGATYYADPKILGGLLKGYVGTEAESENAAIELLRQLLYKHASQCASDKDLEELAERLESYGVR